MADFTGRSLLAVFAHPDDESLACGGLLAWCAQLGARVSLLCVTRGEHGLRAHGEPADARTRELAAAARILGVSEVVVLDHEDGMLPWVDAAALEADIGDAIRRLRPDVVITFGDDGLYWHPDHIAVHERTTAAIGALGTDAPALYYVTMPPGRMRAVVDAAALRSGEGSPRRILGISDADAFGTLAAAPTLVIETGEFAVRKLAAIKCHQSQLEGDALNALSESDAVRLLGTEHFRRAPSDSRGNAFIECLARRT
jgi:N-acetyl-1-D-myo-inositol-2-amino-2-deoxy-alpha-D-glucopyranoside deacetylase